MDNATNQNSDRDSSSDMDVSGIDISKNNQSSGLENPELSGEIRNDKGQFVKGVSGNPKGKPKGTISPIARLKQMFEEDPKKFEKFVKDYGEDPANRKHVVEMIDGKPKQTLAGDKENPLRIVTIDKEEAEIYDIIASKPEDDTERQD